MTKQYESEIIVPKKDQLQEVKPDIDDCFIWDFQGGTSSNQSNSINYPSIINTLQIKGVITNEQAMKLKEL